MTAAEFLALKLGAARAELDTVILNRNRWDKVREDCRMLVFLQGRSTAPDFRGVRRELECVMDGQSHVPDVSGPRRKAADCLAYWEQDLKAIEEPSVVESAAE
jgi:hypothetical protein